jgi:AcrR family transcriptional regulator
MSGPAPREPRPARRGRTDIAAQMLEPVEELLAEGGGFTDLTVAEIIERAGIKRSTFYYHFSDKAELLIEISERALGEIVAASHDLYRLGADSTWEEFHERVRTTVMAWLPHVPLMNALAELSAYDPRVREQFEAGWATAREGIRRHIIDGQHAGFVRPEADPDYTAAWLTWMAERGMGQVALAAPGEDLDRVGRALADIVWRALYTRA